MRALIVSTLGDPSVVSGEWDELVGRLDAVDTVRCHPRASPNGPPLLMESDVDTERPVNPLATALATLRTGHIFGPALVAGRDRAGTPVGLELLEIIRLGARLVRAERAQLT